MLGVPTWTRSGAPDETLSSCGWSVSSKGGWRRKGFSSYSIWPMDTWYGESFPLKWSKKMDVCPTLPIRSVPVYRTDCLRLSGVHWNSHKLLSFILFYVPEDTLTLKKVSSLQSWILQMSGSFHFSGRQKETVTVRWRSSVPRLPVWLLTHQKRSLSVKKSP